MGWLFTSGTKVLELQLQLLAVQGTLKNPFQHHNLKSISSLTLSLLYGPTLTSIPDSWKKHSFDYMESKEIKPVNAKGNQPQIFIGRTDAEAEAPTLWPPDVNS